MNDPSPPPVYFLLVDDLQENLLALAGLLRRDGLVILKAQSGVEALELLLRYDVALALVDVQMPGMDGFQLAEMMRGTERTRRVPIIFVTAGGADRQRRFRGYEAGAVDFLHKPIEADILRSKAEVFFELCRQRQEVATQRDELRAANEENSRLLRESEQHAAALREADRLKDEFLAILAHELRNPLGPIRNAIEVVKLAGDSPDVVEGAHQIVSRQVSHMARLIDDLLDVARIARGKVQLRIEPGDLSSIVHQTAEDYRPTLEAAGVDLRVELAEESLPILGDATRLAQVVGNLLHNAAKFTPRGGWVRVTTERGVSAPAATVAIQDSGVGLPEGMQARLFQPFSQAEQGLDREKGGLGLGLALVKGLVELHGGTASATSQGLNLGSTFRVTLPLATFPEEEATAPVHLPSPTDERALRILVIEDNPDAAKSLATLLKYWGHEVEVAFDGASGLAAARGRTPDVVFSDLGLPGEHNGFAVATAVRQDADLKHIYLVALSGYGHSEVRKQSAELGFDLHLVKPVASETLRDVLRTVSSRRSK